MSTAFTTVPGGGAVTTASSCPPARANTLTAGQGTPVSCEPPRKGPYATFGPQRKAPVTHQSSRNIRKIQEAQRKALAETSESLRQVEAERARTKEIGSRIKNERERLGKPKGPIGMEHVLTGELRNPKRYLEAAHASHDGGSAQAEGAGAAAGELPPASCEPPPLTSGAGSKGGPIQAVYGWLSSLLGKPSAKELAPGTHFMMLKYRYFYNDQRDYPEEQRLAATHQPYMDFLREFAGEDKVHVLDTGYQPGLESDPNPAWHTGPPFSPYLANIAQQLPDGRIAISPPLPGMTGESRETWANTMNALPGWFEARGMQTVMFKSPVDWADVVYVKASDVLILPSHFLPEARQELIEAFGNPSHVLTIKMKPERDFMEGCHDVDYFLSDPATGKTKPVMMLYAKCLLEPGPGESGVLGPQAFIKALRDCGIDVLHVSEDGHMLMVMNSRVDGNQIAAARGGWPADLLKKLSARGITVKAPSKPPLLGVMPNEVQGAPPWGMHCPTLQFTVPPQEVGGPPEPEEEKQQTDL